MSLVARCAQWLRRNHPLIAIVLPWPSQVALLAAMVWCLVPWTMHPSEVASWIGLNRWPVWVPAVIATLVAIAGAVRLRSAPWTPPRRRVLGLWLLVAISAFACVAVNAPWAAAASTFRAMNQGPIDVEGCVLPMPSVDEADELSQQIGGADRTIPRRHTRAHEFPYATPGCVFGRLHPWRGRDGYAGIDSLPLPFDRPDLVGLTSLFSHGERLRRAGALQMTMLRNPTALPTFPTVPALAAFVGILAMLGGFRDAHAVAGRDAIRLLSWCVFLLSGVGIAHVWASLGGGAWVPAMLRMTVLVVGWGFVVRSLRHERFEPAIAVVWPTCAVLSVLGLWFVAPPANLDLSGPLRDACNVGVSVVAALIVVVVSTRLGAKEHR